MQQNTDKIENATKYRQKPLRFRLCVVVSKCLYGCGCMCVCGCVFLS